MTITEVDARRLEQRFLGGLNDAQDAYEEFVNAEAWIALGFQTYVDWWTVKVVPVMRALKMRPTREIVAAGIDQVRKEEAALPPLQRRTQKELGEMFDVNQATVSRSPRNANACGDDLDGPTTKQEPAPKRVRSRRPLPDFARDTGWAIRREAEKLERIGADDRLGQYEDQVAAHLRGHLTYTMQVCQDLLNRLNQGD